MREHQVQRSIDRRMLLRTIASMSVSVVVEIAPMWKTPAILSRLASKNAPVASGGIMSNRRRLAMFRHLKSFAPIQSLTTMSAPC